MNWQGQEGVFQYRREDSFLLTGEMLHPSQAWPPAASCPSSEPGPVRTKREQPVPALPSRQDPPEVSRPPPKDPHLSHLLMSCRLINHPGLPGAILTLALEVLYSGKPPSPGQTRTVSHPSCHLFPF